LIKWDGSRIASLWKSSHDEVIERVDSAGQLFQKTWPNSHPMQLLALPSLILFASLSFALKDVKSGLKIGIRREVKPCRKYVEEDNWVYAHVVARVEGRAAPVMDTYSSGKPLHFKVNNTEYIKGFGMGFRGACEGEIRRITIPPELAYREEQVDGLFGSQSSWVVDAEILEVVKELTI
jgi:FK506-binding protein 2